MKRWTLSAASLALAGGIASVFAAAPVLHVPKTANPVGKEMSSTQFWCDLPAPGIESEPVTEAQPEVQAPAASPLMHQEPRKLVLKPPTERTAPAPIRTIGESQPPATERMAPAPIRTIGESQQAPAKPKVQRLVITPDVPAPPPIAKPEAKPAELRGILPALLKGEPVKKMAEPRRILPLIGPEGKTAPKVFPRLAKGKEVKPVATKRWERPLPWSWDQPEARAPELPREFRHALTKREEPVAPSIPWPTRAQGHALRLVSGRAEEGESTCSGGVVAFAAADHDGGLMRVSYQEEGPLLPPTPEMLPNLSDLQPIAPATTPRTLQVDGKTGPLVINVMQGGSLVLQQDPPRGEVKPASAESADAPPPATSTPAMGPTYLPDCCGSASPSCYDGFLVMADLLVLRPRTSALPFSGTVTPLAGTANSFAVEAVETELDWNAGCRFGVGYRTGDWTFLFVYTHLDSDGSTSLGQRGVVTNSVYAALGNRALSPILDGLADAAAENREFHYDVYDLQAGPRFQPLAGLECQAFVGFRAAEICDHSQVQYFGGTLADELRADIARDLSMQAWGLRGGLSGQYLFGGSGFGLLADGSLSLLYAEFDAQRSDALIGPGLSTVQVYRASVESVVPVVELRVGVVYRYQQFLVATGYEFNQWFNFYQHADVPGGATVTPTYRLDRGDLSLSGWFARAGFRY